MYETDAQIGELQAIMDRSFERLGPQGAAIIHPERRLNARQIVRYLEGMKHIVVGTVTSKGEPRVAPVDGHFLRGRFWFGTGSGAFRVRHVRRDPAISACHVAGDDLGIVVHGRAVVFGPTDPEGGRMREHYTRHYGSDPYTWPGAGETGVGASRSGAHHDVCHGAVEVPRVARSRKPGSAARHSAIRGL